MMLGWLPVRLTRPPTPAVSPVIIKVSPIAHLAVGFLTLGLLIPVLAWPPSAPLLVIPVVLSAMIIRLRTVADDHGA